MIIHSKLKDGKSSIKATIEIEPDSISVSLPGNACVNICINRLLFIPILREAVIQRPLL